MIKDSMTRAGRALAALAALLAAAGPAAAQDDPGSWAPRASGDTFSQGAAVTDGTYLYTVGGMQFGHEMGFPAMFAQIRRYDPVNDTWETLAPMDYAVSDNAAAFHAGVIYSFGGADALSNEPLDIVQAYDVATGSWSILDGRMPSGRSSHAAATLGDLIYVTGGYDGDFTAASAAFDPATGGFSAIADLPAAVIHHAMSAVGDRLYAAAGMTMSGVADTLYSYDPDADSWTTREPMTGGRYGARSFTLQGRLYVTGGFSDNGIENATLEYDPANDSWATRATMLGERYLHGAVAIGAKGYVYGGAGVNTGEEFTAPNLAPPPPPPANHAPTANAGGDRTVEATSSSGASVTLEGSGSDEDGDELTYSWSGSFGSANGATPTVSLAIGTHVLTLTVTDGTDETTDSVTITVADTTAPTMSGLSASPDTLWSPNKDMRQVTVSASCGDAGDAAPECEILSVTCNQDAAGDIVITGAMTVNVRAQRSNGCARVYTILVRCTDSSGNSSQGTVTVTVPHSQGNDGADLQAQAKKAKK